MQPGRHRRFTVLIAEDNRADIILVSEALRQVELDFELVIRRDGEEMLWAIASMDAGEIACPDVVLLDLNLPKRSGLEILPRLRASLSCAHVPVIIVTSSDAPKDREAASRMGADSYFRKPSDFDEFMQLGPVVKRLLGKPDGLE